MHSSTVSVASIDPAISLRSSVPAFACSKDSADDGIAASPTEIGARRPGPWLDLTSALERIASVTGSSRQTVEELVRPIVEKLMHQADMVATAREMVPLLDAVAIAAEDCTEDEMELINGLIRLKGDLARARG